MVDLNEHRGGNWLEAGNYTAKIVDFREFQANTGNKGVEITFEHPNGKQAKGSWMLLPNCYWRLANLCDAAGLSETVMRNFNERNPIAWLTKHLSNKRCGITVSLQKGSDRYHEVTNVFDPNGEAQPSEPESEPQPDEPADPQEQIDKLKEFEEQCPF